MAVFNKYIVSKYGTAAIDYGLIASSLGEVSLAADGAESHSGGS